MDLVGFSFSVSAWAAIALFIAAGSSMSWILIEVTSIPQDEVS